MNIKILWVFYSTPTPLGPLPQKGIQREGEKEKRKKLKGEREDLSGLSRIENDWEGEKRVNLEAMADKRRQRNAVPDVPQKSQPGAMEMETKHNG